MESQSHTPAGYCPFCDYAIDPGKCPECGRVVEPDQLSHSIRGRRIRRVIWRGSKVVAFVALLFGVGYAIYHEAQPDRRVKYFTTNYLFKLLREGDSGYVADELIVRYRKGVLSKAQTQEMLTIETEEPWIGIRSPRPVGLKIEIEGNIPFCGAICGMETFSGPPELSMRIDQDEIWIDDRLALTVEGGFDREKHLFPLMEGLGVGKHDVEIRRFITYESWENLSNDYSRPKPAHVPCSVMVTGKQIIEVTDKQSGQLIPAIFDTDSADVINASGIFTSWSVYNPAWRSSTDNDHLQLAGYCYVFPIDSIESDENQPCVFKVPHDICRYTSFILDCRNTDQPGPVVFVPDADVAFDAGFKAYFGGVIEWDHADFSYSFPAIGAPDRIRAYDASEVDELLLTYEQSTQ